MSTYQTRHDPIPLITNNNNAASTDSSSSSSSSSSSRCIERATALQPSSLTSLSQATPPLYPSFSHYDYRLQFHDLLYSLSSPSCHHLQSIVRFQSNERTRIEMWKSLAKLKEKQDETMKGTPRLSQSQSSNNKSSSDQESQQKKQKKDP